MNEIIELPLHYSTALINLPRSETLTTPIVKLCTCKKSRATLFLSLLIFLSVGGGFFISLIDRLISYIFASDPQLKVPSQGFVY